MLTARRYCSTQIEIDLTRGDSPISFTNRECIPPKETVSMPPAFSGKPRKVTQTPSQ